VTDMTDSARDNGKRDTALVQFERGTDKLNLEQVRGYLAERSLAAVVPFSPANVAYVTNLCNPAMMIIYHEGDNPQRPQPVLLASGELVFAGEKFGDVPRRMRVLAEVLRTHGLAKSTIGVDLDYVPTSCYDELRRLLPDLHLQDVTGLFWQMRSVKSEKEIGFIRAAIRAQEAGAAAILELWREGVSMDEIRRCYVETVMIYGAVNAFGGVCNRLAILDAWGWHGLSERPRHTIRANDEWDLDVHPHDRYQGYYAGMAMSVYVGDPPAQVREACEYRWRANDIIVSQVRSGMTQSEVFAACRDAIERELGPYPFGPWQWLIHGVGLTIHEQPMVGTLFGDRVPFGRDSQELRFQDNMVVAVESGFGVEQMWVLRGGKLERLHRLPRHVVCV